MMIPKTVYEVLPYLYMSGGVATIGSFNTFMATGSGLIFFVAGALIWILRSNNRRQDPKLARKQIERSQGFYEFKPFLLILIGVLMINWVNNWVALPISTMTILFGFYIIMVRSSHRAKKLTFSSRSRN